MSAAAIPFEDFQADKWIEVAGPLRLPVGYCPVEPNAKQELFLRRNELEVMFGGAAGPGKSWGLLMASLQYIDFADYHALLLRPTLTEFEQPGGLIEVAHDWLDLTDANWHGGHRSWTFPTGATLRFGYLSNLGDLRQYKGPSYSFVGFDELTGFDERLYRGMFRVLRQPKDKLDGVPVRMRSASNPGDVGHEWVKSRFVKKESRAEGVVFVPASIHDNPHMNYDDYLLSLAHLDPVDRMRLIDGDWDVTVEGGKFRRDKFAVVERDQVNPAANAVRYWDLAGSVPSQANPDPDYTVGLRLEIDRYGKFTIADIVRGRWDDDEVQRAVRAVAEQDGRRVPVFIEQDPGQAGKAQISHYQRHVLQGFVCNAGSTRVNGRNAAKSVRASPVAAAVGNNLVQVVRGEHLLALLDEAAIFPNGSHDDIIDALSGAHTALTGPRAPAQATVSVARARIPTGVTDRVGR